MQVILSNQLEPGALIELYRTVVDPQGTKPQFQSGFVRHGLHAHQHAPPDAGPLMGRQDEKIAQADVIDLNLNTNNTNIYTRHSDEMRTGKIKLL